MSENSYLSKEPMLEMFVFETNQFLDQLEEILLNSEKQNSISDDDINEIFRIMHTIKGSAAMMMFSNISSAAHSVEDLFYIIRENKGAGMDKSAIFDLVFNASDFIKTEISKIESGRNPDGQEDALIGNIREFIGLIKETCQRVIPETESKDQKYYIRSYQPDGSSKLQKYRIKVFFEEGCQMENLRAYSVIHNLESICRELYHRPADIIENQVCIDYIIRNGFDIYLMSDRNVDEIEKQIYDAIFIKSIDVLPVDDYSKEIEDLVYKNEAQGIGLNDNGMTIQNPEGEIASRNLKQNVISVNTSKLDKLMDIVGEIVISESMVSKNPDLIGLKLDNFNKAARHLRKLTDELQDIVMSIRMVPVAATFHKMNRIVRDMGKKLNKEVELIIQGEETEVDKHIIDHLSDPLMHLIRNAMDHGIENAGERIQKGKPSTGRIILDAKNTGSEVLLSITDDGRGLDKEKILKKAKENELLLRPENELNEKDIYSLILLPGFSTKEKVTEYSGRGVGMDVVKKNIEKVGGSIFVESQFGGGTTISIHIPLTLAIIEGMEISVGGFAYTIPITAIKESFKAKERDIITDTGGNELIMIRGSCYPIVRLHKKFGVETPVTNLCEGIMIMVEGNGRTFCLFADKLIGEQQAVVKPLPAYLGQYDLQRSGIGGCTILGDGSISLILDISRIIGNGVQ